MSDSAFLSRFEAFGLEDEPSRRQAEIIKMDNNIFMCGVCGKEFDTQPELKRHARLKNHWANKIELHTEYKDCITELKEESEGGNPRRIAIATRNLKHAICKQATLRHLVRGKDRNPRDKK